MGDVLKRELATYDRVRDELLGTSLDRYVLIFGDDVVGVYDTERDAINEGYRQFGNVPFLVKEIVAVERPMNFLSGLVAI